MMKPRISQSLPVFAAVAGLWTAAFVLSCALTATTGATGAHRSVLEAALGQSRMAFSGYFFDRAEREFHRGVDAVVPEGLTNAFFGTLVNDMKPRAHTHLHGSDIREMMPWFRLMLEADPQREDAYISAAFWLMRAGHPDEALTVLEEGRGNVRFSYRIAMELGRVRLKLKQPGAALRDFETGLAFWPGGGRGADAPVSPDDMFDKAEMLQYRALLNEQLGNRPMAMAAYRELLTLYPGRPAVAQRLKELESNAAPAVLPLDALNDKLGADDAKRGQCTRPACADCGEVHEDGKHVGHTQDHTERDGHDPDEEAEE